MSAERLGPVTIGAREIYDKVVRLEGSVDRLVDQNNTASREMADHEARLRNLERGRWPLPSLAVVISLVSILITALPMLIK